MRTPTTLELLLLAMHDCGERTTETCRLAGIVRDTPTLLVPVKPECVASAWRCCVARQLVRMGKPSVLAWRVAAHHPNYQRRITLKDLRDSDLGEEKRRVPGEQEQEHEQEA
jgi:hypothetical protein